MCHSYNLLGAHEKAEKQKYFHYKESALKFECTNYVYVINKIYTLILKIFN